MSSRTRKVTIITALTTIPITGITGGRLRLSFFHLDMAAVIGEAIMAVIITAAVTTAAVSTALASTALASTALASTALASTALASTALASTALASTALASTAAEGIITNRTAAKQRTFLPHASLPVIFGCTVMRCCISPGGKILVFILNLAQEIMN
jgi:hypothetical protein